MGRATWACRTATWKAGPTRRLPPEVVAAGDMVLELTKERGMFFLDNVLPENVTGQLDRGVMIGAGRREDSAEVGREYSGRTIPW